MSTYTAHIYREMRLVFEGIEADSLEAAAAIARDKPTSDADEIDDCEGETFAALVDVQGDADYGLSRIIDFGDERLRKAAPALLEALESLADQADEDCPEEHRSRHFIDALDAAPDHRQCTSRAGGAAMSFAGMLRLAMAGEITVRTWWGCNGLTGEAFRRWFRERLDAKINREDRRGWRRLSSDYHACLRRDANRLRDITGQRIIHRQFETDIFKARFSHLLTKD